MAYYYQGTQVLPPGAPGIIGSYVWAVNRTGSVIANGGLVAGSNISPVYMQITSDNDSYNFSGAGFADNTFLSGTWMNVGPAVPGVAFNYWCISLWVRVA